MEKEYPILEFDPTRESLIEPHEFIKPMDIAEHCVICFFQEVLTKVIEEEGAKKVATSNSELGEHAIYELEVDGQRLAFFHPGIGAPFAAALLEEVIARGCRKFIVCGGAGVLDREIAVGHVVVPIAAVRDEGTSYHYLPPTREVHADPKAVAAIESVLERHEIPYVVGKTWTTDAFYRETLARIRRRREEGCITVEMEAAAFFAVAKFRRVSLAQMLYGGDDVSGEVWDDRNWNRHTVREQLFWLAAEACLAMP